MNLQNKINEDLKNEDITLLETEILDTIPEVYVADIPTGNGNLSDLPSIIGSTIPEKKESEQIQKLDLKYPTKHLKGFDDLRKATRLFGNEYILIIKAVWYFILHYIWSNP